MKIDIYTDGSGTARGPCAWAFVVPDANGKIWLTNCGGQPDGTSNIAEMQAIIAGLEWAQDTHPAAEIHIHTDSAYCMNAFRDNWIAKWMKHNWKNSRGRKVANKELWLTLIDLHDNLDVHFHKVKSHSGNQWNDLADELCGKERLAWLDGLRMTTSVQSVEERKPS